MFDFDSIQIGNEYNQAHDMRLAGISDAFSDGVSEAVIWQAFAEECCQRIGSYKSWKHLIAFWFSSAQTMHQLALAEPEMFLDVVNHFQAKIEELT